MVWFQKWYHSWQRSTHRIMSPYLPPLMCKVSYNYDQTCSRNDHFLSLGIFFSSYFFDSFMEENNSLSEFSSLGINREKEVILWEWVVGSGIDLPVSSCLLSVCFYCSSSAFPLSVHLAYIYWLKITMSKCWI